MSKKLFDFCIGNPPYQTENALNNRQEPVAQLIGEKEKEKKYAKNSYQKGFLQKI